MIFLKIKKEDSTQLEKSGEYLNFHLYWGLKTTDTKGEVAPVMTEVSFSRSENSCIVWCGKNQTRSSYPTMNVNTMKWNVFSAKYQVALSLLLDV